VGTGHEGEAVLHQELVGDVTAELAAYACECVGNSVREYVGALHSMHMHDTPCIYTIHHAYTLYTMNMHLTPCIYTIHHEYALYTMHIHYTP
jgi:hypothetical protein